MRTFFALLGIAVGLIVLFVLSPLRGLSIGDTRVDMVFGAAAVVVFLVAIVHGLVNGPGLRAITLAIMSLAVLLIGGSIITTGDSSSITTIAVAASAALLILAVEEAIRARLWRWQAAFDRFRGAGRGQDRLPYVMARSHGSTPQVANASSIRTGTTSIV